MPTFIEGIIVGAVARLGLLAAVLVFAGCGGDAAVWPKCLHEHQPLLVQTATPRGLRQVERRFEAVRAADVSYAGGEDATVVRSRSVRGAWRVQIVLRVESFGYAPPLLPRRSRPSAVLRKGTVVLQWFGKRDRAREQGLLACAAS